MAGTAVFISDLHLALERPGRTRRFVRMLERDAAQIERLYILGDLFDAYVGDDDWTVPASTVRRALRRLVDGGTSVFLQRGNRDFLLGERFCRDSGAVLLEDCAVIDLFGIPTLLMHGDLLCSDDLAYQAFRRKSRDPTWQRGVLAKPLWVRLMAARWYRWQSLRHKKSIDVEIMDVNRGTVQTFFERFGVDTLIHGHTHRPAIHHLGKSGQPILRRFVLHAWEGQPQALVWSAHGYAYRAVD